EVADGSACRRASASAPQAQSAAAASTADSAPSRARVANPAEADSAPTSVAIASVTPPATKNARVHRDEPAPQKASTPTPEASTAGHGSGVAYTAATLAPRSSTSCANRAGPSVTRSGPRVTATTIAAAPTSVASRPPPPTDSRAAGRRSEGPTMGPASESAVALDQASPTTASASATITRDVPARSHAATGSPESTIAAPAPAPSSTPLLSFTAASAPA